LFYKKNLGGLDWNRTSDTRIFNPLLAAIMMASIRNVSPVAASLSLSYQSMWRINLQQIAGRLKANTTAVHEMYLSIKIGL
jgi:hypothetical protein